jgi:hypothetical protein
VFFIPSILHKRHFSLLNLPVKQGSALKLEHASLRQLLQNIFGHESWNNKLRKTKLRGFSPQANYKRKINFICFFFYVFEMACFYGGMRA